MQASLANSLAHWLSFYGKFIYQKTQQKLLSIHSNFYYLQIVCLFLFLLFYLSGLQHCVLPEHQGLKSTTKVPRLVVSPCVIADREYFPTGASIGGVTERATMPLSRTALLSISYFHIVLASLGYLGDGLPNWERVPRLSNGAGPEVRNRAFNYFSHLGNTNRHHVVCIAAHRHCLAFHILVYK